MRRSLAVPDVLLALVVGLIGVDMRRRGAGRLEVAAEMRTKVMDSGVRDPRLFTKSAVGRLSI